MWPKGIPKKINTLEKEQKSAIFWWKVICGGSLIMNHSSSTFSVCVLAVDALLLSLGLSVCEQKLQSGQTSPAKPTYLNRGAKLYYPVAQCHLS